MVPHPQCPDITVPPARSNPVRPAARSRAADRKASRQRHDDNTPIHDFRSLLTHLGTLTRNELRFPHLPATPTVEQLTIPTPCNAACSTCSPRPYRYA